MKVTCPHCDISGTVDEAKLRASSGRLRCPGCKMDFTVPLSQPGADPSRSPDNPDEDIIVTDDIHAAHADAMEAAMSESINDIITDDSPDDIDDLLSDPDVKNLIDLPDDLDYIDDALDDFGVPEQTRDAADTPAAPDESAPGRGPTIDGAPGGVETGIDDDEPLILEEVVEVDREEAGEKAAGPGRRLFTLPSLPSGVGTLRRLSPLRGVLSPLLLVIILLSAGVIGVTRFCLPFRAEKAFIEDSRAMFEEYRRLQVFLNVGVSDSVYIASVAESSYSLLLYRDEYGEERAHDPLYAAVTITGDLFLATVSFIDRTQEPDIYAGSEWGTGLPYDSREAYTTALLEEMSRCLLQINENMAFLGDYVDALEDVTFLSFFLDRQRLLDHSVEAADFASIHEDLISTPFSFPFFADIVSGIEKDLSGLR